jgi:hypothetical protein
VRSPPPRSAIKRFFALLLFTYKITRPTSSYLPYGSKILDKQICGGTLTSLTEDNLDVLLVPPPLPPNPHFDALLVIDSIPSYRFASPCSALPFSNFPKLNYLSRNQL